MSDPIDAAFDPERFRADGHRMIDRLADYLAGVERSRVSPDVDPEALIARAAGLMTGAPLEEWLDDLLDRSVHQHHPGCVAHQVTAPLPIAAGEQDLSVTVTVTYTLLPQGLQPEQEFKPVKATK